MKSRKLIFDSIGLGLSVLALIFFALPLVSRVSAFSYLGLISAMFEVGGVYIAWALFLLLLLLSVIALIVLYALLLLCNLGVMKSEKLYAGCHKANKILAGFNIFFVLVITILIIALTESFAAPGYAFVVLEIAISIATLVMLAKSKKTQVATQSAETVQPAQPTTEQPAQPTSEQTVETDEQLEEPKEKTE